MGSNTREVITLQLGHYSNFVGTHWWNIQDSTFVYNEKEVVGVKQVDNDVLFREGVNQLREVTYTPRLVIFDLKGSLRTLKEDGVLYDTKKSSDRSVLWPAGVSIVESPQIAKNRYLQELERTEQDGESMDVIDEAEKNHEAMDLNGSNPNTEPNDTPALPGSSRGISANQSRYNLDDSVNVWSDFLRPYLHPKSINVINEYQHESETSKFEVFGLGERAYSNESMRSGVENRLRFFTEECDGLQGFQLMIDSYNGFGGFSAGLLDDVADDYSNKSVAVFLPTPAHFRDSAISDTRCRIINNALSYERLLKHSSMILPISLSAQQFKDKPVQLPNISYKATLPYHTSSILAANIDTLTLPYRLLKDFSHMTHLTGALTPAGRKMVALRSSFPVPLSTSLSDTLMSDDQLLHSLTPDCLLDVPPYCQSVVIRGVTSAKLYSGQGKSSVGLNATSTVDEVISMYMKQSYMTGLVAVTSVEQGCKIADPFPNHMLTTDALRGSSQASASASLVPDSVPVMTCLESSSGVKVHIDRLKDEAKAINLRTLSKFLDAGLEIDDFRETLECLEKLSDCYSDEINDMD